MYLLVISSFSLKVLSLPVSLLDHLFFFLICQLFNPGFESLGAQSSVLCCCLPMDYVWPGSSVPGIFQARIFWSGLPFPIPLNPLVAC